MKILSAEEHNLLKILAKRKSTLEFRGDWRTVTIADLSNQPSTWTCVICGGKWEAGIAYYSYVHGIKHLQESNLLPFL